jgi:2-polyprenyl-6-methoxyphenol hydroxylase-like FAD-dependent oxidoreductase
VTMTVATFSTSSLYLSLLLLLSSVAQGLNVAIIGGGPAGLAVALALSQNQPQQQQPSLVVFERDFLEPKGASVVISKSGWEALDDLFQPVVVVGGEQSQPQLQLQTVSWKDRIEQSGVPVTEVDRQTFGGVSETKGGQPMFLHSHLWHSVRAHLAEAVQEICGTDTIRCGRTLTAIRFLDPSSSSKMNSEGNRFELDFQVVVRQNDNKNTNKDQRDPREESSMTTTTTSTTETIQCQAIIAADGVGSAVRKLLEPFGEPQADAIFLNERRSVWRGIAPNLNCSGRATFFRGDHLNSALVFPAGAEGGASWTVICPTVPGRAKDGADAQRRAMEALLCGDNNITGGGDDDETTSSSASSSRLLQLPPLLQQAIAGSSRAVEHRLAVRDFETASYGAATDGAAFVGDAQHPVRPTGEGLALAFSDAVSLRRALTSEMMDYDGTKTTTATTTTYHHDLWCRVFRSYENEREPIVRELSALVRASAESFYSKR